MAEQQKDQKQLNIELNDKTAEGVYSNLAMINHSPSEFIVDFIQLMPGVPKARVKSRIILTPQHAKRLLQALSDNIDKYENNFGDIQDQPQQPPVIPFNFGPPGEA